MIMGIREVQVKTFETVLARLKICSLQRQDAEKYAFLLVLH